jgi:hypothetical protein
MPASMHRFDLPRRQAFAYSSSGFVACSSASLNGRGSSTIVRVRPLAKVILKAVEKPFIQ